MLAQVALLTLAGLLAVSPAVALRDGCAAALTPSEPITETALSSTLMAHVAELLPESVSVLSTDHPLGGPSAIGASVQPWFTFIQPGYINLTFIHEGAGYRNQVGIVDLDTMNHTLLFPDLSFYWPGCMEVGDMMTVGPFQVGQRIGLYLKANGYNRPNYRTWYTNTSLNVDGFQHHLTVLDHAVNGFIIGIEDLNGLGDEDFNDAVLHASILLNPSDSADTTPVENVVDTSNMLDDPLTECLDKTDLALSQRSEVSPTGIEYAILDGTPLWTTQLGGQSRDYRIPATGDWDLADAVPGLRAQIPCHMWGAPCLAFGDDVGLARDLGSCAPPNMTGTPGAGACTQPGTEATRTVVARSKMTSSTLPNINAGAWAYPYDALHPFTFENGVFEIVGVLGATSGLQFVLGTEAPGLSAEAQQYGVRVCAEFETVGLTGTHDYKINQPAGLYGDILYADGNWSYGIQGRTNTGTHSWEEVCIDYDTGGKATQYFYVNAIIRDRLGLMRVRNFRVLARDGNLAENAGLDITGDATSDGQILYKWNSYGSGGYALGTDAEQGTVVNLTATSTQDELGVEQIIFLDDPNLPLTGRGLYLGAKFKTSGVSGLSDRFVAVYADVHFADGSKELGLAVPFPTDTAGEWVYRDRVRFFETPGAENKVIARINVLGLLVNRTGTVLITDLEVRIVDCYNGGPSGYAAGDPHYMSLSGVDFDLQTTGIFSAYLDGEAELQIEHSGAGAGAIATGMAFVYHGSSIELQAAAGTAAPTLRINKGLVSLDDGAALTVLPQDNTTSIGPSIRRDGAQAGLESSRGIPLTYIIDVDSETHAGEGYKIEIGVFVSSFNVQFFTVSMARAPASALATATGLFTVDTPPNDVLNDAGSATERRQLGGPRDQWSHNVLGPMYVITNETRSGFKVINGRTPDVIYNASTASNYLASVGSMDPTAAANARSGPCAAYTGRQQDQCVVDVVFTGDPAVGQIFQSIPPDATEELGSNATNPNQRQPLPSNPPSTPPAGPGTFDEVSAAATTTLAAASTLIALAAAW